MSREDLKMKARMRSAPDHDGVDGFGVAEEMESYQSQVKERSDLQRAATKEHPTAAAQALPAWIKTQVQQLEMRRKARHGLGKYEPALMQKSE